MLKKLRKKFILVSMISISVVLFTIIGIINTYNFININNNADIVLTTLKDNDGKLPRKDRPHNNMMQNKYFTVYLDNNGEVISTFIDKMSFVSEENAKEYALKLYKNEGGYYNKYKYLVDKKEDKITCIFLDLSRELDTFFTFLYSSIIISFCGLILVLILVLILSKIILKPFQETYQKQKQFITDANHELKTPLAVINASTEVLELNNENEWTRNIKEQVNKLTELTNKLIFLSRMDEDNKNNIFMTDFSLTEILNEAIKPYISLAKRQNKTFIYEIEENITYNGDTKKIKELIDILLDNAFKYSSNNGEIKIKLIKHNKNIKLTFYNTCDNIPQGNLDILFDRFYRLDSSRNTSLGGYGIGLSIAKAIVEMHKGKINAYSSNGKEIIFTINL